MLYQLSYTLKRYSPRARPKEKKAERTGFEPAERFDPFTDLANRRFRPLSHRSVARLPIQSALKPSVWSSNETRLCVIPRFDATHKFVDLTRLVTHGDG